MRLYSQTNTLEQARITIETLGSFDRIGADAPLCVSPVENHNISIANDNNDLCASLIFYMKLEYSFEVHRNAEEPSQLW